MTPDAWSRVSELVERGLDVPETERSAWLAAQAPGEDAVVAEARRLLQAHARAGRFLETPLIAQPGAADAVTDALTAAPARALTAGHWVGPYRILREIGRGGMGAVYLAARSDDVFEKLVAIKLAPGALASAALRDRFNQERHLLATLDHPGIARVLDGGTLDDLLPYLVMEYIDGTPIDAYCRAHGLGVDARVRLVVEVCRAVQHAHDHLVVHRDIKASNVLVDAEGRPKLLDFGIAKTLVREVPGRPPGATLVQAWTPESASPEQVRGEATTIATDVYGLGTLLYTLLTDGPVFDMKGRDPLERARLVCEALPRRPSVAARDGVASHGERLGSDLDVITLKALHKDPARRYRSAEHLAEDLERHLARRPVLAVPDTWRYRARKLVARHPVATAATAVALATVLAATATALWQARRADQERHRAEARLTDVRRLANTLIFDLYDGVANSPSATSMRRTLVEQGLQYLDRLAADAGSDVTLGLELAEAYRRLAQVQGDPGHPNLGDRAGALASLDKGRALLAPLRIAAGDAPEAEAADLKLVRQRVLILLRSDAAAAHALAADAVVRSETLRTRHPDRLDVVEALANTYFTAALAGPPEDALRYWTDANRAFGDLSRRVPDAPEHLRSLALTEKYIGAHHHTAGALGLARTHYERALDIDRKRLALNPRDRESAMDLAFDLGNVASTAWETDPPDLAGAAALYRESLALREDAVARDPEDVFARQALGFCLMQLGSLSQQLDDLRAATDYARRAVDAYEALPPSEQPARRGLAWLSLGRILTAGGHHSEGCTALTRARAYYTQASDGAPVERQQLPPDAFASVDRALAACAR